MLQSIIKWINGELCELVPGAKTYGVARTAKRDDGIMPVSEDDTDIIVDDAFPFKAYHKELTLRSAVISRTGYGDSFGDLANTYEMGLIVFFDEQKLGVRTDELYTLIQTRITGILKIDGYKLVRIGVTNAILNDSAVWTQEYGSLPFKLFVPQRLIQIGYSVMVTLDKNCFPKCISKS